MTLPGEAYGRLLGAEPPRVNIGTGNDVTIRELAQLVGEVVGYAGDTGFEFLSTLIEDRVRETGPPWLAGAAALERVENYLRSGIDFAYLQVPLPPGG